MSDRVIIELAGRDSFSALLKYLESNKVKEIIPTIVKAPPEYGSFKTVIDQLDWVKEKLTNTPVCFSKPLILEDQKLWWILNGRYLSEITQRYGFYTPCIGCHLYFHLMRIDPALNKGITKIISGERELHEQKIKINQTPEALDSYKEVLAHIGLDLVFPLRKVFSNEEVEKLLGKEWEEGQDQLSCAFKNNYCSIESQILVKVGIIKPYLKEFLIPVGKIIAQVKLEKNSDYFLEIESYLKKKWAGS